MSPTNISSIEPFSLAPNSLFFVTCQATCPLTIYDRLVWSWLLRYRHAHRRINISAVSEVTGVKRSTLYAALHRLYAGVDTGWFVTRPATNWYDGFAYFVVEFDDRRSLVQDVLLGLLRSLRSAGRLNEQSYAGLATMIGCERRAVRRALAGLTDRVEIVQSTRKRYRDTDRFDIILKEESAERPPEPAVKESPEPPREQPVEQPTEAPPESAAVLVQPQRTLDDLIPGFKSMDDTAQMHVIMELYGYSLADRNRIVELIEQRRLDFPVVSLAELVTDCNKYHRRSGRKGTAARLVIYKLEVMLGLRDKTNVTPKPKPEPDWNAIEHRKAEQEIEFDLADIRIELERLGATPALTGRVIKQ